MLKTAEIKHTCKFCGKDFKREKSLIVHMCEPKKRYRERTEKGVRTGFNTYLKFYEYSQGSAKLKTEEDFRKSPYYNAFVKFGRYCKDINAIKLDKFADFVIHSGKKLDHWAKDSVYGEYIMQLLHTEHPTDALSRGLLHSMWWADQNNANDFDILRFGNVSANCYAITKGELSAWVVYNSDSGQKFLSELNEDQMAIIWDYINPDYWQKKFKDYEADQLYIKEMLKKAGW